MTTGHTGHQMSNNFGYDEFLRLCEELTMPPLVEVPLRGRLLTVSRSQRSGPCGNLACKMLASGYERLFLPTRGANSATMW